MEEVTKTDNAVSWWGGTPNKQCFELMLVISVQVIRCLIKLLINTGVPQVGLSQDKTTTNQIDFIFYPHHGPDQLGVSAPWAEVSLLSA